MCTRCSGFYAKEYFARHKQVCRASESQSQSMGIPARLAFGSLPLDDTFNTKIVQCFHADAIGTVCRTDHMVLTVGRRIWAGSKKKDRKGTMKEMVFYFRETSGNSGATREQMLLRKNFHLLNEALDAATKRTADPSTSAAEDTIHEETLHSIPLHTLLARSP